MALTNPIRRMSALRTLSAPTSRCAWRTAALRVLPMPFQRSLRPCGG